MILLFFAPPQRFFQPPRLLEYGPQKLQEQDYHYFFVIYLSISLLTNLKIKCVALAPPPVFRSNFINPRFKRNIHIFINENDVVPRLSLHNIAKLMTLVRMIDKIKSSLFDMVQILTNKKEPDQKYIDAINEVEQDEFQRLDHPGKKDEPFRSSNVQLLYVIFSAKNTSVNLNLSITKCLYI